MRTLIDTGPLVAAIRPRDKDHADCARLLSELPGPLLLPPSVLIEACWLISSRIGPDAHATFLRRVRDDADSGRITMVNLAAVDLTRMAELVRTYRDLRLDATDASVIAIAERLDVRQVATLDRRDFGVVRPRHIGALRLVP